MELRHRRPNLFWIAFFLVGGIATIWASQNGWELMFLFLPLGSGALLVAGLIMVLGALAGLRTIRRPAPIFLDGSGLRLHVAGIDRSVPWTSVDALILEPYQGSIDGTGTSRLLLVPAADADLGMVAEYKNKVDGRSSIILLSLNSLRASQDEVIRVLTAYAGQRFINGVSDSAFQAESPGSPL